MSATKPVFCCSSAVPVHTSQDNRLHNDPNRVIHDGIFRSFLLFAARRQRQSDLISRMLGIDPDRKKIPVVLCTSSIPEPWVPRPVLTLEALANNPCTPQTPYVIHLTCRHDFGPVYSHRYFACPNNLQDDWVEISLVQWFAEGTPFKMTTEQWDLKCEDDATFFRLTLRPNLALRWRQQVVVGEWPQEDIPSTAMVKVTAEA
ncbi:hypothetical protein BJ875DRAFT_456091 [Amylocarpus encephaloides]|uniref:Uncharacterized protein n=1 Tax=Amylocarpus encephaloides TaxID=45428 RepID=A0A9P8C7Q5_9HELO|nr:hypothetical protein BJ875DRAFT_456091 [Amylocarpus encephaloides]